MKAKKSTTNISKIEKVLKDILRDMATKDDLKSLEENIDKKLKVLRKDIKEDIAQASMDVFKSADENKAEKADLLVLERRVDNIEKQLTITH